MKIRYKTDAQKSRKIDAKMEPKINDNWSKNRLGADFGLQNLAFGGFWSDAKISFSTASRHNRRAL